MPLIPKDQHTMDLHVSIYDPWEPDRAIYATIGIYAHEPLYIVSLFATLLH